MIDLHSHFLPMIDDGASGPKESVEMLRGSFAQGVGICVGTPHAVLHDNGSIGQFLEKREKSIELLETELNGNTEGIPSLLYGAEIYLDNDISEYGDIKKMCIGGTNCMVVEFSTQRYNPDYHEWLYSLTMQDIIPIVAHIERYPYLEYFLSDVEGVNLVFQINDKTLLHSSGRKLLLNRYEAGDTIVVASDMHNTGFRKSAMKKAYDKICKHYPNTALQVFEENARKLLGITQ